MDHPRSTDDRSTASTLDCSKWPSPTRLPTDCHDTRHPTQFPDRSKMVITRHPTGFPIAENSPSSPTRSLRGGPAHLAARPDTRPIARLFARSKMVLAHLTRHPPARLLENAPNSPDFPGHPISRSIKMVLAHPTDPTSNPIARFLDRSRMVLSHLSAPTRPPD